MGLSFFKKSSVVSKSVVLKGFNLSKKHLLAFIAARSIRMSFTVEEKSKQANSEKSDTKRLLFRQNKQTIVLLVFQLSFVGMSRSCKLVAKQGAQVHRPLASGAVCGDASSFAHHPLLRSLRTGCAGQRSLVLFLLDFSFFGPLLSDWSTSSF